MGGSSKQTTSSAPWKPQQPYLTYGMEEAKGLYGLPSMVPMSAERQQALDLTGQRALAGSPLLRSAQDFTQSALTGGDAIMASFAPQLNSMFARGGRYGGTARAEALGRGFANAALPYAQLAPSLAAADYGDLGQLSNVGREREAYQQYMQDEPARRLDDYLRRITGNLGQTQTGKGGKGGSGIIQGMGALGSLAGGAGGLISAFK